jgi:phenylalanine-4-hydroxylase
MTDQGELRAYGAGILSSYGEIEEFRGMDIRPLDLVAMGTTHYDITKYQDVLFRAESLEHLEDVVGGFWATCDDEIIGRILAAFRGERGRTTSARCRAPLIS